MLDFEKNLLRLEDIVKKMENGELSLDESLKLFEEGVKLSRDCNKSLTEAEGKVKILMGANGDGTPSLEDFKAE